MLRDPLAAIRYWFCDVVIMMRPVIFLLMFTIGCGTALPDATPPPAGNRYLALGDSYTIGQSVDSPASFPLQLVAALRLRNVDIDSPRIIARTGWTTDDLDGAISASTLNPPYKLVTLLIGVNDQFQGGTAGRYRPKFVKLLQRAIALAGGDTHRVLVFSIPDYGVTPFASGRDGGEIGRQIDGFNAVNREESARAGARYVDINPISKRAAADPALIASDGLHPSGAMYSLWVEAAEAEVVAAVSSTPTQTDLKSETLLPAQGEGGRRPDAGAVFARRATTHPPSAPSPCSGEGSRMGRCEQISQT